MQCFPISSHPEKNAVTSIGSQDLILGKSLLTCSYTCLNILIYLFTISFFLYILLKSTTLQRDKRIVREFGIDMYTLLHLKRITNKNPLYSTGNSVVAWMGGEFGEEWIYVDVWLSPFAIHLKLS